MKSRMLTVLGLGILAVGLTGCPKRQVTPKPEEKPKPEETQKPPAEEPSLRGKEYQQVPQIAVIYFDLDSATLRADARTALDKNYTEIKMHADWEVLVEGHCDERGTTEYNLALGQRRAAAVRQYYINLGLSGTRIATISYGKEMPACTDHTEACWSNNRRAVTKVRSTAQPAQTDQSGSSGQTGATDSIPDSK